ncbi:MnhB domain-containing protein [Candidatus Solirubrobacter pratensis]|uniref:MnhB domain-containing protein n=1 Tax=Candidatus Solirubrobacter pratensis TaxID=1298857 RepID=UPI0004200CEE|nr:MnhB domain-containing protein [Candidatus Solirubrobacter pratensis]
MSWAARRTIALAGLALLGAWVVAAVAGLPDFGHPRGPYATAAVEAAVRQRHVTSAVAAVTFDIRGIDTLGEELILFCAAIGATLLLRVQRASGEVGRAIERRESAAERTPDSMRVVGAALAGPLLVVGVYVLAHGHLTPGGGFQGGIVLASALLLAYVAGRMVTLERAQPVDVVEAAEAAGAGAYVLIAAGGLVFATAAMANFLPLGTTGDLLSGGTIPVLNVAVGVEVAAAITLILTEFLDQALLRHRDE